MTDDLGKTEALTPHAVAWWHTSLRAIAVLNLALWSLAVVAAVREHASVHFQTDAYLQLLLSAAYVGGCAFRSFLPVIDIPRIVLIDTRLSSVRVGRSVATVAELSFAAQWALMLYRAASLGASPLVQAMSLAIVPMIALAEAFSWYAVLTTGQRAHAVENSLWGLSAALVIAGMLVIGPQRLEGLFLPTVAGGIAYIAFIFVYDVPMYWARWRVDQKNRHIYMSVADGMADVGGRWMVSYRWDDWKNEIPWMTLYFTFGVWSSIWLIYASLTLGRGH
jgi:hypothetical protein